MYLEDSRRRDKLSIHAVHDVLALISPVQQRDAGK